MCAGMRATIQRDRNMYINPINNSWFSVNVCVCVQGVCTHVCVHVALGGVHVKGVKVYRLQSRSVFRTRSNSVFTFTLF